MTLKEDYDIHRDEIDSRLGEFSKLNRKEWFNELAFCILTPQSNAEKCWNAVSELKSKKFDESLIEACLMRNTRFYKNKTRYLSEAKKNYKIIEQKILELNKENVIEVRNWIAENVRGVGLKEASHFLRNIGKSYNKLAILDRHILRRMNELALIEDVNIKNMRDYWEIERKLIEFSNRIGIPLDALDLLFFKLESGRIFK